MNAKTPRKATRDEKCGTSNFSFVKCIRFSFALLASFRAGAAADEAIGRRAMELLEEMQPKLQEIYTDFDMQLTEQEKNPKSLEDAISPYMRLLDSLM